MKNEPTASGRFPVRYGPWALVAGASEGLGAGFARALARRGMNLLLIARRKGILDTLGDTCRREFNVHVTCLVCDLGAPGLNAALLDAISGLDIGVAVYNAAYAPVGDFSAADPDGLMRVVDVNVRGPVILARTLLPLMIARRRGALILMSSLAGNQGSPRLAMYAASKAFNAVLAEGVWHEVKDQGVDVLVCTAGAVRTPGFAGTAGKDAPGTLDPDDVVEQTLRALGRGPRVIPGFVNQLANWFMGRLLPRRVAISIMASSTKDLTPLQR